MRAFGKQITMSTDKGACRDLTGRRIRHVNNEKKLKVSIGKLNIFKFSDIFTFYNWIKDFLTNQAELKKQKEQEKKEKERRKKKRDKIEAKHHMFVDPKYDEQKQKIAEDLDQAISKGIDSKKSEKLADTEKLNELPKTSSSEQTKPIETKQKATTSKMLEDWMGVGDLDVSSSSEDEEVAPVKSKYFNWCFFLIHWFIRFLSLEAKRA